MKNLTPSVYTFEDLILGDYLYIDKTEYLWNLVQERKGLYFLARPRRFGKSLTLSTLEAIFSGKRELFKGLAIYDKPYDWKPYPIIHLNFTDCAIRDAKSLEGYLDDAIQEIAAVHNITLKEHELSSRFSALIAAMDAGEGVVVLVDEYDKPILSVLNMSESKEVLAVLKGFYSAIKKCERHERFVFVTGITKFCHVSLFSDLNNLQDISRDARYATMLGYTQEELEAQMGERMPAIETREHIAHDELLRRLKLWYDGYRFVPNAETVYNPVSIANFFLKDGLFANYWYSTGTTSSLFQLMKQAEGCLPKLLETAVDSSLFDSFDLDQVDLRKLMYQTGYLTIGETDVLEVGSAFEERVYHLRFPNYEVQKSFNSQVMEHYAGLENAESSALIRELAAYIRGGNVDGFMNRLKVLFAQIPYNLHGRHERDYQTILYVIFLMLKVSIAGEYHTNEGRVDLVLSSGNYTYVIELKMGKSARRAMAQIWDRDYARGFLGQGRRVIAVGVAFNQKRGQIDNWVAEEVDLK